MAKPALDAEPGVTLRPLEVSVPLFEDGGGANKRTLGAIFRDLQKRGIDTGRPMWLHIDRAGFQVTAKQDPWEAE
jgi:hypothetical protein